MAFKTFTPGLLTSSDVNTFLMQQAVITCTSSTRPSSPVEGMTIYETDTDQNRQWSGTAWEAQDFPGAWRSYSPTLLSGGVGTDWAIGNGTVSGTYCRVNRFVGVTFQIVMGSTTTFGTKFLALSLPFNSAWTVNDRGAGVAFAKDASPANTYLIQVANVANQVAFGAIAASGTFGTYDDVDSTTPFTWAANDRIEGTFIYEAAS